MGESRVFIGFRRARRESPASVSHAWRFDVLQQCVFWCRGEKVCVPAEAVFLTTRNIFPCDLDQHLPEDLPAPPPTHPPSYPLTCPRALPEGFRHAREVLNSSCGPCTRDTPRACVLIAERGRVCLRRGWGGPCGRRGVAWAASNVPVHRIAETRLGLQPEGDEGDFPRVAVAAERTAASVGRTRGHADGAGGGAAR
ncbi:uncharacterized protein LOC119578025, partial [Penaeus monodon]|uniref:uncharacterized protein LOC119578025 n=1 Tax=Penaeus monodon TaxID=6687 RepID=UPI0018A7E1CF